MLPVIVPANIPFRVDEIVFVFFSDSDKIFLSILCRELRTLLEKMFRVSHVSHVASEEILQ